MTSLAPGLVATPSSLLTLEELGAASNVQLAHTIAAVLAVQHQRATSSGDIDALIEQAFADGFTGRGDAERDAGR